MLGDFQNKFIVGAFYLN